MKKFILSFGLSALFLGAMAQDNAKPVGGTGPQISLDKEVHDYGTAPIKPGAKTTITVKYDTKRPGPINKSVTISSNATNAPEKVVRIKGTVEAGPETPASPVKEQSPMAPVEKTN